MNCKTEEDVIELGISLRVKARVLFKETLKYKMTDSSEVRQ
jgi:hypothetical protein